LQPVTDHAEQLSDHARLLVSCPDGHGIVAAVAGLLSELGANIVTSDQHSTDPEGGRFFLRMEFHLAGLDEVRAVLERRFDEEVAARFGMTWSISYPAETKRVALLVSRRDHCLLDLLWRWRRGDLPCEIACVISNHLDCEEAVAAFGVPYHHVPVAPDAKPAAEARILELLDGEVELVALARYMQILSDDFLARVGVPVINIHHSFLPAFVGAGPYERAWERGVKLIGATAHYVTADLDEGPIIEQDIQRVTHRDSPAELERVGADIERSVFSRAVKWHLEDRVLVHENRTIVFT
jgi:formyltetrahydrofolate deformylase